MSTRRQQVRHDLERSAEAFEHVVWPNIQCWWDGPVRLHQTERSQDATHALLDMRAGVDFHVESRDGMESGAARVQFDQVHQTITVRTGRPGGARTEFEKRIESIQKETTFPKWCVHAYVASAKLSYASRAKTRELFEWILGNSIKFWSRNRRNYDGSSTFSFVWTRELREAGCDLREWPKPLAPPRPLAPPKSFATPLATYTYVKCTDCANYQGGVCRSEKLSEAGVRCPVAGTRPTMPDVPWHLCGWFEASKHQARLL